MSLFAKTSRAAAVILALASLPSYALAQQVTVVPPGNSSAEQPEIPRASAIRTRASYTTYDEKFRKTVDLLNSEPALLGKIKKAAAAYGIDPSISSAPSSGNIRSTSRPWIACRPTTSRPFPTPNSI
jgi:hypothetical protein